MVGKTKWSLVILVAGIVLAVVNGGTLANPSDLPQSAMSEPYLSDGIVFLWLDNAQVMPAIAYNSLHDEYLVVWQNTWGGNKDIYAQRITGQGEVLSWFSVEPTAPLNPYPNDRIQPAVAYDSTHDRYLVVWAYDVFGDGSDWDIHGVFVDWDGPIQGLHQSNICDWTSQQSAPKVAYSPVEDEYMIVWQTDHPSVPDYISGRRMNASDGTFPSTGSDFTISNAAEARVNPEIAYNTVRNEYLIVYDNTEDIFGSRYSGTAVPQNAGEFPIAAWPGAETLPAVAYCSENGEYLVAWQNNQPDIYARYVDGDGVLDGGPLHLDYTSVGEIKPKVACTQSGNQFLVTWQQQYSAVTGPYGIAGQFVNTNKTLGTAFGIIAPTSGVQAEFTTPVVAGGRTNFLTVWEHDRAGTAFQDIHGLLIAPYAVFLPLTLGD